MPEAVDFYAALGARVLNGSRDGDFTLLQLNVSELSLLAHPPNPAQDEGQVELNFVSSGPLTELEEQLRSAGVQIVAPTSDESLAASYRSPPPTACSSRSTSWIPSCTAECAAARKDQQFL